MATATGDESEFGQVSRLKGIAFRYITFGASLLGIVSLFALVALVIWDAFGLEHAGSGWYLTVAVTLGLPLIGFLWYANRHPVVAASAFELVTASVGGLMFAVAIVIVLSVIAGPPVWFAYFLTVVAPAGVVYGYGRHSREANWTGLGTLGILLVGPIVGTIYLDTLSTLGSQLGPPGIYFLSLVVPTAIVLRYLLESRFEYSVRSARVAGIALPVIAVVAIPLVDRIEALTRPVWLILLAMFLVPTAVSLANTVRVRERRPSLYLPAIAIGGYLLGRVIIEVAGFASPEPWLDWQFLTSSPSITVPENAGLYPAIVGSILLMVLVAVFTFIFGVGTAIYLEEYAPSGGLLGSITRVIQVNISNLAGVPSVVYGLLGLGIFVNAEFSVQQLGGVTYTGFGVGTALAASMTLSLLILPIVVISAQEALRGVPDSTRQASYGMGATRWQTIRNVVIPEAVPGILTGTILALGRAIGETAPLIIVGAATTTFSPPTGLFSKITAMPMQIYAWAFQPGDEFRYGVLAAGVVTLLVAMLTMNSVAILVRNKYETET